MKKLESKQGPTSRPSSEDSVVVNMEWGAFGEEGELDPFLTVFDKRLDAASLHPGKQTYVYHFLTPYCSQINIFL